MTEQKQEQPKELKEDELEKASGGGGYLNRGTDEDGGNDALGSGDRAAGGTQEMGDTQEL